MTKNPVLFYKILVIGVIILFVIISLIPGISAVNKYKVSNEVMRSKPEYKEIITFVRGFGYLNWINKTGYFHGEVNITSDDYFIRLLGLRWSNGCIEYFNELVIYLYSNNFIGHTIRSDFEIFLPFFRGFAFGDIKWY